MQIIEFDINCKEPWCWIVFRTINDWSKLQCLYLATHTVTKNVLNNLFLTELIKSFWQSTVSNIISATLVNVKSVCVLLRNWKNLSPYILLTCTISSQSVPVCGHIHNVPLQLCGVWHLIRQPGRQSHRDGPEPIGQEQSHTPWCSPA